MKIQSRGDQTIRQIMIDKCYVNAGEDEVKTYACDEVERDTLEALWRGLPFDKLLLVNSTKYMEVIAEIEKETYINLI